MFYWTIIFVYIGCVNSQSNSDVNDVINYLFTTNTYNKLIRPATDQTESTMVYIEFYLYGLNSVDEVEQKVTTVAYLEISWIDEMLSWDPTSYNNLQYIYLPQSNIWLPDIALQNGFQDLKGLGSSIQLVHVYHDGTILWSPFHSFESKCMIDATYFPFEKQRCNLDFVAWSMDSFDINLVVGEEGINMDEGENSNSQWDIISSTSTFFSESRESKVRFTLVMKRKPLFYIINIILPIILLSVLNIFTFQIPADIGERMGYTVTTWLSFAVFLTIISSSLPKSSDSVPILSIYIMIQLFVGTGSVLLSAWESRAVGREKTTPVPSILKRIVRLSRRKCKRKVNTKVADLKPEVKESEEEKANSDDIDWKESIGALDALCFWTLTVVLIISTVAMLLVTGLHDT